MFIFSLQNYGPQPTRQPIVNAASSIKFGDTKNEYQSLAQDSFKDFPKTFKRARPLLEKEELLKTNYSLGEEKTYY